MTTSGRPYESKPLVRGPGSLRTHAHTLANTVDTNESLYRSSQVYYDFVAMSMVVHALTFLVNDCSQPGQVSGTLN